MNNSVQNTNQQEFPVLPLISMIAGILSTLTGFGICLTRLAILPAALTAIAAIVCAIVSKKKHKPMHAMAVVGLIFGILSAAYCLIIGAVFLLLAIVGLLLSFFSGVISFVFTAIPSLIAAVVGAISLLWGYTPEALAEFDASQVEAILNEILEFLQTAFGGI